MLTASPDHSLAAWRSALDRNAITSSQLTQNCIDAAVAPAGEGHRTFTDLFLDDARTAALAADRTTPSASLPLRGLPLSVKDLFDIAGHTTHAGSIVLNNAPAATADAAVVARLKDAGAVIVGRTNMTEFAFSGLGLNPHYGTPRNPWARSEGRIPGGSSSGAAISVCDGMAVAAIGSDTGGSIRIPAALCGLTGFKPTARRVSTQGVLPLSTTLDSIGPIAPTVACCAAIDQVLSGQPHALQPPPPATLRLGVLEGYVLDDLEPYVASRFQAALSTLSNAGVHITHITFNELAEIPHLNRLGGFSGYEAWHWHRDLIAHAADRYDPRVLTRIQRGSQITDHDYATLQHERTRLIAAASQLYASVDAWVLPTVPRIAPLISQLEASDDAYFDANAAMLLNPALINFLDGCAISIPSHLPGEAPTGLMLSMPALQDTRLLSLALTVERLLLEAGYAIPGQKTL